jgi:predicted O-methyltransferase YrrM
MLDERVLSVLARIEQEDEEARGRELDLADRSLAVPRTTGRLLFSLVAGQEGCEVLELGASHGYSSIWLGAGVRYLGGHVLSLEQEPKKIERWRRNVEDAGLSDWVELREGDAFATLEQLDDVFDVVFLDAWKPDYEALFALARRLLEPGGSVIADNVLSSVEILGAYSAARQADPTLSSVTIPLDNGLELTTILK